MNIRKLWKFDKIGKKFFIPSILFIVALFAVLTAINVSINNSLISALMDKRGKAMVNYMAKTSVFYYTNYDLGALDGFVQEAIKDPDLVYAVFYDENKNPLTITSKKPADTTSLMNHEQAIVDAAGKTIGLLSIGYSAKAISAVVNRGVWIMLLTMAVALILLSVGITFFVRNVITRPLGKTVIVANKLTEGDLTVQLEAAGQDEIGQLIAAFKNMVAKLKVFMSQVSTVTMSVNSLANDIAVSVEQQATVSAEQSTAVAEITATMEELSTSSTQIAEHAKSVVDIATKTWENTKNGATAVERIMMKMNEIHADNEDSINEIVALGKKSREISKVMEIINTIADQTKLIAFNAALEASSAGEAGKRFGVVAVEIRRLADSVMESTGEIESKINEIQEAVNRLVIASEKGSKGIREGMEHSNQTASALMDVVDAAQSTQEAAKQISLSTQQQKTASSQVVTALREIVAGSDQTSDAIRQISAISRKLTDLSASLKGQVKKFKVEE
ncbi:MAG: HAMP domain-containing methyl-accepting chemotaxis protein [Desulfobacterales bacterium]|nr:HAMP domain-containing methyl-accepting chemotaxis protein [Desulfobacterales bacterium]